MKGDVVLTPAVFSPSRFYYVSPDEGDDVVVCRHCRINSTADDFEVTHVCVPVELVALCDRRDRGF